MSPCSFSHPEKERSGGRAGTAGAPWMGWRGCLSAVLQEHLTHRGGCHLLDGGVTSQQHKWKMDGGRGG